MRFQIETVSRTVPLGAAHTYMVYIREDTPGTAFLFKSERFKATNFITK